MSEKTKEFVTLLSKLDEKGLQKIKEFLDFLTGMTEQQKAIYEELKHHAEAAYNGDPAKVYPVIEYAIPKIKAGEAAADIWGQYQQEGGGVNE